MDYSRKQMGLIFLCIIFAALFSTWSEADEKLKTDSRPKNLPAGKVTLTKNSTDPSANGLPAFKIETKAAIYYLEKKGGGLSSLIDKEGKDWLGFHPEKGTGAGGEYRGFPNAVLNQGGNYFHAKNVHADTMKSRVEKVNENYVSIIMESLDGKWQGRYEFFSTHCTFSIIKMPASKKYWVLYEGTPGGKLDADDWWMTSAIKTPQKITKNHKGDIPSPEWIAFGDAAGKRSIVLLNHEDDEHPDSFYQMHQKMTVFGFGRQNPNAYLTNKGLRFSIGLVENGSHHAISEFAKSMQKKFP